MISEFKRRPNRIFYNDINYYFILFFKSNRSQSGRTIYCIHIISRYVLIPFSVSPKETSNYSAFVSPSVCLSYFSFQHLFSLCVCGKNMKIAEQLQNVKFVASNRHVLEKINFYIPSVNDWVRCVLNYRGQYFVSNNIMHHLYHYFYHSINQ